MPECGHRSRDRITGGRLAGVLTLPITFVGGLIKEGIAAMRGLGSGGGEVLVWCMVSVVVGALLGSAGAGLAKIVDRVRHQGGGLPPHHGRS